MRKFICLSEIDGGYCWYSFNYILFQLDSPACLIRNILYLMAIVFTLSPVIVKIDNENLSLKLKNLESINAFIVIN